MSTINWTVTVGATSFTSITQSLSFSFGRGSDFDTPTGGTCTFTVRNNTGQAASINQGDVITIGNQLTLSTSTFYVVEVTFQDEIASGANTATITGVDAIGQISQFPISGATVLTNALQQIAFIMNELAPFNPPYPDPSPVAGRAFVEDTFNATTIGQRIIELLLTENGRYYYDGNTIVFVPSSAPNATSFTFGTAASTGLVYDSLTRKYPNTNYPNEVNLTSTGVGTTTTAVTGLYRRNYNRQVLFNTAAQQQAQTDYYANVLSVEALYAELRFSDKPQTDGQLEHYLEAVNSAGYGSTTHVTYTPPGGSPTTDTFVVEGGTCTAVPGRTDFTLYLSPTVIYDLFTLNSSTFGILNTNRLGW